MSLLFCAVGIAALTQDVSWFTAEMLYAWALFAIADVMWLKFLFGGK